MILSCKRSSLSDVKLSTTFSRYIVSAKGKIHNYFIRVQDRERRNFICLHTRVSDGVWSAVARFSLWAFVLKEYKYEQDKPVQYQSSLMRSGTIGAVFSIFAGSTTALCSENGPVCVWNLTQCYTLDTMNISLRYTWETKKWCFIVVQKWPSSVRWFHHNS